MIKAFPILLFVCTAAIVMGCQGSKAADVMILNLSECEILVEYSYLDGVTRDPQVLALGVDSLDNETRNWKVPVKDSFEFDTVQAIYKVKLPSRVALKLGTHERVDPEITHLNIFDGDRTESYKSKEALIARLKQEDWSIRYR